MAGMRDTARHVSIIGMSVLVVDGRLEVSVHDNLYRHLVSLVGESQTCGMRLQLVLITFIYPISVHLYFVSANGSVRSEKVTESALHVS